MTCLLIRVICGESPKVNQRRWTKAGHRQLVPPSTPLITSVERNCLHGSLWLIQPRWSTWGTRVNAPLFAWSSKQAFSYRISTDPSIHSSNCAKHNSCFSKHWIFLECVTQQAAELAISCWPLPHTHTHTHTRVQHFLFWVHSIHTNYHNHELLRLQQFLNVAIRSMV